MIETLILSVAFRALDLLISRLERRASRDTDRVAALRRKRDEMWDEIERLRRERG